jgi:hypothetical protein
MNKKTLTFLALIVLSILILMIVYAYSVLNSVPQSSPKTNLNQNQPQTTKDTKDSQISAEIQKLKDGFQNQTLTIDPTTSENCNEEEKAELQQHQEEVKKGLVKIAEGKVLKKEDSYLELTFHQGSYTWISKVLITPTTSIKLNNSTAQTLTDASYSDIQVGDTLLIRTDGTNNILNSEFTASKVVVNR